MKKYNRLYASPAPGGECLFIVAKSKNHMIKILKKASIAVEPYEMEDWGKFTEVAKLWKTSLKKLVEVSGKCYMCSYGKTYHYV